MAACRTRCSLRCLRTRESARRLLPNEGAVLEMNPHTPDTRELFEQFVIPTYARFPLRLARGQGSRVWDEDGKCYLDFGAGIAVCSIGHCHPRVVEAMSRQLGTLVHTSNLYFTRPQGLLAKRLVELV